jgi:hypothetical protein
VNPNRIRDAVVAVTSRLRKGEIAQLADELVGADLEGWLEDLAIATLTGDARRAKRSMREASRRGASLQLALPGLEDAALPPVAWEKDEAGFDVAIPATRATKAQLRREVTLMRRMVSLQDRVVGGYEATLDHLDGLGVADDATGAEILAMYPLEIEE